MKRKLPLLLLLGLFLLPFSCQDTGGDDNNYIALNRKTADYEGKLVHEWRGVKVPGHAAEVLAFVQSLG